MGATENMEYITKGGECMRTKPVMGRKIRTLIALAMMVISLFSLALSVSAADEKYTWALIGTECAWYEDCGLFWREDHVMYLYECVEVPGVIDVRKGSFGECC